MKKKSTKLPIPVSEEEKKHYLKKIEEIEKNGVSEQVKLLVMQMMQGKKVTAEQFVKALNDQYVTERFNLENMENKENNPFSANISGENSKIQYDQSDQNDS
ncbi:hypothetical protein Trichorick_01219 [Candidatus Trichorickettsia mobilis]|uniref:Uncharacterized protein n=1 Tax=Candidatus Trichorickettsia mobilis TaxID=1346319 RepID=A0ABZ0UTF1_9RICK|nr:hypothetical protein [Candidatus Trichorickettsia mobilis]WPY01309.1 hypothetical protein Trichorick_01219 [Candidatus Trichorickettsia mobilis]